MQLASAFLHIFYSYSYNFVVIICYSDDDFSKNSKSYWPPHLSIARYLNLGSPAHSFHFLFVPLYFPGLHYKWLCRSVHTQFPKSVYPNMTLRTPYDTTTQPAAPGTLHSRGCYDDGKFFFPGDKGLLNLNTTRMIEDETYVVFVIITKGARLAHQYQVIEVIQGDPPVSKIE